MRLINADAAKDALKEVEDVFREKGLYPWNIIDQVPTACDIERIKREIQLCHLYPETDTESAHEEVLYMVERIIDKYTEGAKVLNRDTGTCDNCIHCEVCRWSGERKRGECDFWD